MAGERTAIHLPVRPWFADHCFGGRVILAAVEAMQLLAAAVKAAYPHVDVGGMRAGRFLKLLEIPSGATTLDGLVELEGLEKGGLCARLLTRTQCKTLARMNNHCELIFPPLAADRSDADTWAACPRSGSGLEVFVAQVYRELVPFGPAYRTLQDRLFLDAKSARGTLLAPEWEPVPAGPLGSPFPLDGAMHAACVHGQQLVDFVPFPVGFAARRIVAPTRAGERYDAEVRLQSRTADGLAYDLQIVDQSGQVRETVRGLRMRDVSGGRIRPPAWLRKVQGGADKQEP